MNIVIADPLSVLFKAIEVKPVSISSASYKKPLSAYHPQALIDTSIYLEKVKRPPGPSGLFT
jgi:hypothetical protein